MKKFFVILCVVSVSLSMYIETLEKLKGRPLLNQYREFF